MLASHGNERKACDSPGVRLNVSAPRHSYLMQPGFVQWFSLIAAGQVMERPLKNDENSINSNVRHKIVMMGAAKVGKSSLITQFLYSSFSPKYKRTVEEMHHGHFSVGGVNLTLDILDTSGSYEVSQAGG
uniref:Uncharacterized protein n=1 Tax=Anopheles culicifacies TaxID=139723 RepID=A0A182M8A7_9DIPT